MLIDFKKIQPLQIPKHKGGNGHVDAKMYLDKDGKIIMGVIPPKSSIGMHLHDKGHDICYIISGQGKAIINGKEEILKPGLCHYCAKGKAHEIINTGDEDLVMFSVVTEQ